MKNKIPQRKPHKHMSGEEMLGKLSTKASKGNLKGTIFESNEKSKTKQKTKTSTKNSKR